MAEALGDELESFTVRIFATDLDAEAVALPGAASIRRRARRYGTGIDRALLHADNTFTVGAGAEPDHLRTTRSRPACAVSAYGSHIVSQRVDLLHSRCRNARFSSSHFRSAIRYLALGPRDGHPICSLFHASARGVEALSPSRPTHGLTADVESRRAPTAALPSSIPLPPLPMLCSSVLRDAPSRGNGERSASSGATAPDRGRKTGEHSAGPADWGPVVDRRYDIQTINSAAHQLLGI